MRFANLETGEIVNIASYTTTDQADSEDFSNKKKNECRKLYNTIQSEFGNFYFYQYKRLLTTLENDTATAFRFLYLCTFADKDGYIYTSENQKCTTYSDFIFIFDRTKSTVTDFVKALEKYKLVYKSRECFIINSQYYAMNINSNSFKTNSVRAFNNAIRELYKDSNPKEHSVIGEVLKLVPYINIANNTLCWNIEDVHPDAIIPLTMQEIRHVLRPNSDYGRKITNKIENLYIKGEPVLGKFEATKGYQYIINPRLFYRGNNIYQLKGIMDQFDIAKGTYKRKRKKLNKGE